MMKKFKLKYYYLATGMEGIPQEYPEKIIEAECRDEAIYKYHKSNGIDYGSFEDFMEKEKYIREWATSCEEMQSQEGFDRGSDIIEYLTERGFEWRQLTFWNSPGYKGMYQYNEFLHQLTSYVKRIKIQNGGNYGPCDTYLCVDNKYVRRFQYNGDTSANIKILGEYEDIKDLSKLIEQEELNATMEKILEENNLDWQSVHLWIKNKGYVIITEEDYNELGVGSSLELK